MKIEKLRPDGLCLNCGKPRKHAVWNTYAKEQAIADPFCSSPCARAFYDNPCPPLGSALGTPINMPPAGPPTRLQEKRAQVSAHIKANLSNKGLAEFNCLWCDATLPTDLWVDLRKFCCDDHRKRYNGAYNEDARQAKRVRERRERRQAAA